MNHIDLSNVSDDEIFEEAIKRIKDHPLNVFKFEAPLGRATPLTVTFNEGQTNEKEVEGVFIAQ